MKNKFTLLLGAAALFTACGTETSNTNNNTNSNLAAPTITIAERPRSITDMMSTRGEQDQAMPTIKVVAPVDGATVEDSTVRVLLELSGDLKGYETGMDPATKMGNHIHVILDNQPYEAYYHLDNEFELRNVSDGEHTLRVFPSRPWHESYKNPGAFQIVKFTVNRGGADASRPASTNTGEQMSNVNANTSAPANSNANTGPTPEGKDMPPSNAGTVDTTKPLLTYSRPKGEYKGADAAAIMIDFWLANAKLRNDGGTYRVRYTINGGEPRYIDSWQPIWLSGWTAGKYTIKLDLVDNAGTLVDNGGYNSTTREITVTP